MTAHKVDHKRTWRRGNPKRTLRSSVWKRTGLRNKTFWDWLQLLIVPAMIASLGTVFTLQQDMR